MSEEKQTIAIQFDKKDVDKLKKVAKSDNRSVSGAVRDAVQKRFAEDEQVKG